MALPNDSVRLWTSSQHGSLQPIRIDSPLRTPASLPMCNTNRSEASQRVTTCGVHTVAANAASPPLPPHSASSCRAACRPPAAAWLLC